MESDMKVGLLLALALASILLIAACENGGDGDSDVVRTDFGETPASAETPAGTPTVEPDVCQPNPDPATPEFQLIDQPSADDTVTSPVTISGQVLAFEATYQIGIFHPDGTPIVETFGTADAVEAGELAPFAIVVPFDVDESTPACVWIYEESARDGSLINVGQIPVTLLPGGEPEACQPNPDPATPDTTQVDSPAAGATVTSPVTVSGRIAAFEAQFNITIFDAAGDSIVDVPGNSEEGFVLSPFSEDVAFSVSEPTLACLWVYDVSEGDGSPLAVVQIPLTLLP